MTASTLGRMTMIMLSLILIACPSDECRNPRYGLICDSQTNMCWARADDWDTYAWTVDIYGLQEGIEAGTLLPDSAPIPSPDVECWRYGSENDWAHVCTLATTCIDLTVVPVDELFGVGGPCQGDPAGAWDYTVETSFGCYGIFEDLDLAALLLVD